MRAVSTQSGITIIPTHIRMSAEQWIAVPDNPRQRDTERHLKNATHLREPSQTHAHVSMAVAPNGNSWKLDGHTRALYWQRNPDKAPVTVHVTCYVVADAAEAALLYTHFDNQRAVETASDRVSGAWHEAQVTPQSKFLKEGRLTNALTITAILYSGVSRYRNNPIKRLNVAYELIPKWRHELIALDAIHPITQRFPAPFVAAALITIRKHGEKAVEFWRSYNEDRGVKLEDEVDPVEMLSRLRNVQINRGGTLTKAVELSKRLISAFEHWRLGKTYNRRSSGPRTFDISSYFTERERAKFDC